MDLVGGSRDRDRRAASWPVTSRAPRGSSRHLGAPASLLPRCPTAPLPRGPAGAQPYTDVPLTPDPEDDRPAAGPVDRPGPDVLPHERGGHGAGVRGSRGACRRGAWAAGQQEEARRSRSTTSSSRRLPSALRQHPDCNAWWQDDHIRYWNEVHVSMAVAVEDGLITPVIRHADQKSLREIARRATGPGRAGRGTAGSSPRNTPAAPFRCPISACSTSMSSPRSSIRPRRASWRSAAWCEKPVVHEGASPSAPHAAHHVVRPSGHRRRNRRPVSEDVEGDAGESAGAGLVERKQ